MLIGIMRYIWNAAQVLPDELSENSVALAMKNSNSWHTYQDGIVNEILNGIQCFIATHTSNIQILMEIGLVSINRLAGLLADTIEARFSLRSSVLSTFSAVAVACSSLLRRILVRMPPKQPWQYRR